MELFIGADVFPTQSNVAAFEQGDVQGLLRGELLERWLGAEGRVFNLEGPLYDGNTPIPKCGPALAAPAGCAAGIGALKPDCVALANNHILDHGPEGLTSTLRALKERGIAAAGAGLSLLEAAKPVLFQAGGVTVGVYACAEHEFSFASEDAPGANPIQELTLSEEIGRLRAQCGYLIVLMHGGREHYPYPTPGMRRLSRFLMGRGADLVAWQHTHCVGCREDMDGRTAVYGQGNFIFDAPDPGAACWKYGALIRVELSGGENRVSLLPVSAEGGGARLLSGPEAEALLEGFDQRSREIGVPGFVEREFDSLARQERSRLGRVLIGDSKAFRALNALSARRPLDRLYSKEARAMLWDYVSCESLRELLLRALKD